MKIGGFRKVSLIDYPGYISSVIFTQGCNLSCPYCHNSNLVPLESTSLENDVEIYNYLKSRIGQIDAVVFSGGEPTLQSDLPEFSREIRRLGYKIKVDTNGTHPDVIDRLLSRKIINYIAMDVKCPPLLYTPDFAGKILRSIDSIMKSKIDYEFRTTIIPSLLQPDDLLEIGSAIKGDKKYYLQKGRTEIMLNPKLEYGEEYNLTPIVEILRKDMEIVEVR